ncbi:hypothetical protein BURK1_02806 [Burkholderiales bacterium]|nr:hypothetical protein BURK1_02806 [Burkholderiales bacterium]
MNEPARSTLAWRVAVAVCTMAAFALFAWVAAHWIWRWASPPAGTLAAAAPADPAAVILASGLWAGGGDAPSASGPVAPGDVRLLGVIAERDGKGLAVFRTRDGARVVAAGDDVIPGTTLASIGPSSVTLRDAGVERTVELRRDASAPRGVSPASPRVAAAPRVLSALARPGTASPGCEIPPGFSGAVIKLHAELLDGLIAQPESWRGLLAGADGALVVREDGGFATMIGLARGDRIAQANGIPLRQPDDVTAAVLRPLSASQAVRLGGTRGGQPREVFIVNASACP